MEGNKLYSHEALHVMGEKPRELEMDSLPALDSFKANISSRMSQRTDSLGKSLSTRLTR